MKSALNWFEIPVTDIDRAVRFYERALGGPLRRETFGAEPMAMFASKDPGVGGALVKGPQRVPGATGTIVYLDAAGRLDEIVSAIPAAGGTVLVGKLDIGDPGFIAVFRDTEGNTVGLHQPR